MEKDLNPKNHDESGRSTQKKQIFECVICEMIFPKLWIYKNHKKQYHTDQIDIKSEPKENLLHKNAKKPFSCKFCAKSFRELNNMKKHLKVHAKIMKENTDKLENDENQKLSPQIGKTFNVKDLIHRLKDLKCSVCSKTFITKEHLDGHMKIHMKEDVEKVKNPRFHSGNEEKENKHKVWQYRL